MTKEQEQLCRIYDLARKLQQPEYDGRMVFANARFRIERKGIIPNNFGMTKDVLLQAIKNLLQRVK